MCNVILKDPTSQLWQVSVDDTGRLITTHLGIKVAHLEGPILYAGTDSWKLSADTSGRIVATKFTPLNIQQPLTYIPMKSPAGNAFKMFFYPPMGRIATQSTSTLLPDIIPYIPDVSMSKWPEGYNGLMCPNCANASVTVSGDLSCWCCVCSTFVPPEDTTIMVVLSE